MPGFVLWGDGVAQAGFLLTRHWRDTPSGTEVEFWLATDNGPLQVTLPLSKPMVVYQVITAFLAPWLDFIFAKIINLNSCLCRY